MFYGYGVLNNHVPTLKATAMKGGVLIDADVQAFITAASITDATQKSAVNTLVTDLKTYGIWTKMKAIYPFVGGTASQHKFNLKDPRDLDAAYRLAFVNGWTHSSTGVKPNGTDAYADTKLAPNVMSQNSAHLSYYSRTNITGFYFDISSENSSSAFGVLPSYNGGGGAAASYLYMNTFSSDNVLNGSPSTGLYIGNRTASNITALFRNATKIITGNKASLTPSTQNIYLGAGNVSGSATSFSPREQAFASIGDGLTDTESSNLYTAVQAFNTTLSRNV